MGKKVKWTVQAVKDDHEELKRDDVLYTKRIIPFIRTTVTDEILERFNDKNLLTDEVESIIKDK